MSNTNLGRAKAAKDDEYYTLYETIAAELKYYKDVLRGMTVLCNCDDPKRSNFWAYFHFNFTAFGLKKLISTHYEPDGSPSYKMEYDGGDDPNTEAGKITPLQGNGDFRSEECAEILRSCDVVVTNPPFSLWIPYIKSIIDTGKLFVVIGGINVSHKKYVFPLIRDNIIRLGISSKNIGRKINNILLFDRPEGAVIKAPVKSDGRILDRIASWWYTNIDIEKRYQPFFQENAHCYYEGNESKYPKYVNFDGIDINKTDSIPIDYDGYMGVPVSFLDKYNPDDFELIGTETELKNLNIGAKPIGEWVDIYRSHGGAGHFSKGMISLVYIDAKGKPVAPFGRIIIRNRHPISKKDDIRRAATE